MGIMNVETTPFTESSARYSRGTTSQFLDEEMRVRDEVIQTFYDCKEDSDSSQTFTAARIKDEIPGGKGDA